MKLKTLSWLIGALTMVACASQPKTDYVDQRNPAGMTNASMSMNQLISNDLIQLAALNQQSSDLRTRTAMDEILRHMNDLVTPSKQNVVCSIKRNNDLVERYAVYVDNKIIDSTARDEILEAATIRADLVKNRFCTSLEPVPKCQVKSVVVAATQLNSQFKVYRDNVPASAKGYSDVLKAQKFMEEMRLAGLCQ